MKIKKSDFDSPTRSQNALPTFGYLEMTFDFKILEAKRLGYTEDKIFTTSGASKVEQNNVRKNFQKMKKDAIYNGVKAKFPSGTVTPVDVHVIDYNFVYYLNDYKVVNKNGKEYESYHDMESKKTKYYIKDRYILESDIPVVFEDE